MQPKVQFSIPQPCHEDWHKMTPSQQGRFCNACAKQVVDFTTMSDTELLHYFLDKQGEKVCGRMYPDQLNRPVTKPVYPVKKKLWQWNYAAMFLLFLSKSFGAKAQGAVKIIKTEQVPPANNNEFRGTVGMVAYKPTAAKIISGKITDESGEPVGFATVKVKGSTTAVSANADGRYSIKANINTDELIFSAVGYELQTFVVKGKTNFDIVLATSKTTLEGDVIVTVGGISSDYDYYPPANPKHVAVIEVRDNGSHLPVKASIVITKNSYKTDSVVTDAKGIYNLKKIKENDRLTLTINATGYLPSTIEIKGWSFNERKETKYVFLEKEPMLADYKKMDSVNVISYGTVTKGYITMGSVSRTLSCGVNGKTIKRTFTDSLNLFKTKLTGSLKIAPNPVLRGSAFNVTYAVKETGNYILQITNAAGQVLHTQQLSATQKNNTIQMVAALTWGSGLYYVSLIGLKNKLLSTNSFIVH
jgi:hypothetical protein